MKRTIFISIPWFVPAYKAGGPIQSIKNLVTCFNANLNYKIFCGDSDVDKIKLNNIKCNQWENFNQHTQVYYNSNKNNFTFIKYWKSNSNYDFLYIVGIYSFKFNILPLLFSPSKNKILSVRGMLHPGALSQKPFKKKLFLLFLNAIKIQNRVTFHATDETEKKYIKTIFGEKAKIRIANNYPQLNSTNCITSKPKGELNLISVALISRMKNHLLILKALKECEGKIEYHIIGAIKDHDYWKLCLKEIDEMPKHIKVIYHGEKEPHEISDFLSKSQVSILPSMSENYGHAIIEAISAGKPTITSHHTPWNHLEEKNVGFNVNPNLTELKNKIQFFVEQDNEEYQFYSKNASEYANSIIDINKINLAYSELFSI